MANRVQAMIPVLDRRETKSRLALTRLARTVARKRAGIQSLEKLITALQTRLNAALADRCSRGPCTVAALAQLAEHTKTLHATREQLTRLQQQAQRELEALIAQQRKAAHQWRRCETRLDHVVSLVRRERVSRAAIAAEVDDETHAERRTAEGRAS